MLISQSTKVNTIGRYVGRSVNRNRLSGVLVG